MKKNQQIIYHLLRLILAAVFIYASIDKIINPEGFAKAVFNHQVLPDALINISAIILPWLELLIGLCLLFNTWTAGASILTASLMTVFIGVISFNLARGLDVSCGCFSTSEKDPMDMMTFARDASFLLLSWWLVGLALKRQAQRF